MSKARGFLGAEFLVREGKREREREREGKRERGKEREGESVDDVCL